MDSRIVRAGAWTLLVVAVLVCAQSAGGTGATENASIVAIYPDPIAHGDAGEFVVLDLPGEGNYSLGDGEQTIALPANATGRVAVTAAPDRVRPLVEVPVVGVSTFPALANGGDEVILRADGRTVDRVVYDDPEEGAIGRPRDDGITWRHVDATDRDPVRGGGGPAEAFLLPDAGGRVCEELSTADRRIELAGYTLTSRCVTDELVAAADRGVDVTVLVEGRPAGGFQPAMADRLDRLSTSPATVRVVSGPGAPVRYHHAKYAVVDDRAVVLTENFKPAGTGGHASRGWGAIVTSEAVVANLSRTIEADAGAHGVSNWSHAREEITVTEGSAPAATTYPERMSPRTVDTERTTLLLAPDNAESELAARIRAADRRVLIEQAGIGGVDVPLVRAAIDAAENGTRVRILLSSAWYDREQNRAVVSSLRSIADRRDLPIEAKLARPHGRFEKIHAKGVVVDDRAYVGSLNWNNNSIRNNREVVVGLQGERPAAYFARAFQADWVGGRWRLPVGLLAVALIGWIALGLVGRRITFAE
ncbi:MAG: phospholipase D-like domain-containing protein [Halococcoides sp.]